MESLTKYVCHGESGKPKGGNKIERSQWSKKSEFILSCLTYAVGLGNVWRFPYMCFENGGGAFLIPYGLMLFFVGLPLLFIEFSLGQYSACGTITVWKISPLFQGVGAGMMMIVFIANTYYIMICAWALYYLFASFQSVLPWQHCDHASYNSEYCYSKREAEPCESNNGTWFNQTCYNQSYVSSFDIEYELCNATTCQNNTYNWLSDMLVNVTQQRVSPSEEYFDRGVLGRSDSMDETTGIKWDLCLTLLLAWIICFVCICKGIKSSGKVVYFTATFPYIVLTILLCFGLTLPGSTQGIKFYLMPSWDKLLTPKVWVDAAGQIFYSICVGVGTLLTFASYNQFHNNIYRDTVVLGLCNSMTSLFAGFVIFSVLGYMAHELGVEVKDVAKSGSALVFVAYPDVVTKLPVPQLWSILFFLMLCTLGIGSQFTGVENMMTSIMDVFPGLRSRRAFVALVVCILHFLVGLPMCTNCGVYWLELMNYYGCGWSLVLMGLAEAIIFPWIYGADRLIENIEMMVGFKVGRHWWFCWKFITPPILICVLAFNLYQFTPLSHGDYLLPLWAQALGWMMTLASVVAIPVLAIVKIWQSTQKPLYADLHFFKRICKLAQPTDKWKPAIENRKQISSLSKKGYSNGYCNGSNSCQLNNGDIELGTIPLNQPASDDQ